MIFFNIHTVTVVRSSRTFPTFRGILTPIDDFRVIISDSDVTDFVGK